MSDHITIPGPLTLEPFRATSMTFACGTGQVVISFETGKVTFYGCTPDEGARAFWNAVERMFPKRG